AMAIITVTAIRRAIVLRPKARSSLIPLPVGAASDTSGLPTVYDAQARRCVCLTSPQSIAR
ncbi:MAG TPA: hypothetical protein PLG99_13260, partial [Kaistiaceae bacterium]|nr:hypothetical protein [Kaistiaceae bacterium]